MTFHQDRLTRWRKKFQNRFGYDIDHDLGTDWWDLDDSDLQEMYDEMVEHEYCEAYGL